MGGRIELFGGDWVAMVTVILSWLGIISVMVALVPVVAISPILLYIGMLIGSQALPGDSQEPRSSHRPCAHTNTLPRAGGGRRSNNRSGGRWNECELRSGSTSSAKTGVLYHGLAVIRRAASILGGLILGAIGVFIIDHQFTKAAQAFSAAGAVLTFFGFMHGEAIGFKGRLPLLPSATLGSLAFSSAARSSEPFPLWPRRPLEHDHEARTRARCGVASRARSTRPGRGREPAPPAHRP